MANEKAVEPFDKLAFRSALGAFATGVTIVTTRDAEGNDIGLTANSFNSVSLSPPMVLWSLDKNSLSLKAFSEASYFAVHILAEHQQPLSDRFARRGEDKFADMTLERGHGEIPLLEGCAARFECKTAFKYEGGDHEIFVGEVVSFRNFDKPPLAFLGGKYAVAVPKAPVVAPPVEGGDTDGSFSRNSLSYLVSNLHYLFERETRKIMGEHGLSLSQFYTISQLGNESPLALAVVRDRLRFAGLDLPAEDVEVLVQKRLVTMRGEDEAAMTLGLTGEGRTVMVQSSAVIKALDEDAQVGIPHSEMQLLHQLLKKVLRNLVPGS